MIALKSNSLFGVIDAFTRAAQGLSPIQRIEMERFAGRLPEDSLALFCSKRRLPKGLPFSLRKSDNWDSISYCLC